MKDLATIPRVRITLEVLDATTGLPVRDTPTLTYDATDFRVQEEQLFWNGHARSNGQKPVAYAAPTHKFILSGVSVPSDEEKAKYRSHLRDLVLASDGKVKEAVAEHEALLRDIYDLTDVLDSTIS